MRLLTFFFAAAALLAQNRIVSTSPAITETLFALGAGNRVVGVSQYCNYPAETSKLTRVGSYLRPSVETIVRLRPDLVIVERLPNNALEQLKGAGIRVLSVAPGDVETNIKMMETIATATGTQTQGRSILSKVRAELERIRSASKSRPQRSAIFIVGRTPGKLEGMIAVGKGSYLNELITIAGGRNLLADSPVAYPRVSLESVVRLQPDVIIDMGDMAETQGVSEQHKRSVERMWRARSDLKAGVHAVASDIFVVPGPRMVDAAREFQRLFHGGAGK